jgi:hypothetical protein
MVVGAYALICSACALGRVEILISEPNISQSSGACTDFVLYTIEDFTFREGMDLENQIKKLRLTKNRIYDVYRALGTVPEWEIDALVDGILKTQKMFDRTASRVARGRGGVA